MSKLTNIFSDIAEAIRSQTGTSDAFKPSQMASAIENIPSGGTDVPPMAYMSSTISQYEGNETYILNSAFYTCSALTTALFPECSYIGNHAFTGCHSLTTISFPQCSYIGDDTFTECRSLTAASFPQCNYIGSNVFAGCRSLATVSFPQCSYLGTATFQYCSSLTTASFPKCSLIGQNAFKSCTNLSWLYLLSNSVPTLLNSNAFNTSPLSAGGTGSIYVQNSLVASFKTANNWSYVSNRIYPFKIPDYGGYSYTASNFIGGELAVGLAAFSGHKSLQTIIMSECSRLEEGAFQYCSKLTTASFPKCNYIGTLAFNECSSLTTASFPKCNFIGSGAFNDCTTLSYLYLLNNHVPNLKNSNAFNNSPLSAGGSGFIYVQNSLVASFKTASNWSYVSDRIYPVPTV